MARSIAPARSCLPLLGHRHAQVVQHGETGEDAASLGDVGQAELADAVGREPRDVVAVEVHRAGAAGHEARDGAGERALPRPVRAQHREHRSRLDRDRHAEERLRRSVADIEVAHLEEGLRHASGACRRAGARRLGCRPGRPRGRPGRCGSPRASRRRCARRSRGRTPCPRARGPPPRRARRSRARADGPFWSTICAEHCRAGSPTPSCRDRKAARRAGAPGAALARARPTSTRRSHAQRQRGHRSLGDAGQPQHLEQPVDVLVLALGRRQQRTGVEHVAPEAHRRTPRPVGHARGARAP